MAKCLLLSVSDISTINVFVLQKFKYKNSKGGLVDVEFKAISYHLQLKIKSKPYKPAAGKPEGRVGAEKLKTVVKLPSVNVKTDIPAGRDVGAAEIVGAVVAVGAVEFPGAVEVPGTVGAVGPPGLNGLPPWGAAIARIDRSANARIEYIGAILKRV